MNNPNHAVLMKEYEYYSRIVKELEKTQKEKEISSTALQLHKSSSLKQTNFSANIVRTAEKQIPFSQKYSFNKPDYLCTNNSKRTVIFNQNFKAKYALSKNQAPKFNSTVAKFALKSKQPISNMSNVHKRSVIPASFSGSQNPNSEAKKIIKEIESLTALLKKKTSENQARKLNCLQKCVDNVQSKLLSKKHTSFDKPKFVNSESVLLKAKHLGNITPDKNCLDTREKIMNSYTKVNSRYKSTPLHFKTNNQSKYCYKKVDNKQAVNVTTNSTSVKLVKNVSQFQKTNTLPHSNKVIISGSKKLLNSSINCSKSLDDLALNIKQSSGVSSVSTACKNVKLPYKTRSPSLFKFKTSNLHKSPKVTKLKTANTRYIKINQHLSTPNKPLILKSVIRHSTPLSKNMKGKLGNKYKVVNKSHLQSVQDKKLSAAIDMVCKDDDLKNVNHPAIDKLEEHLMASTELTASLLLGKNDGVDSKIHQNSISKTSFKSSLKIKRSAKKFKPRISKYKIVNSNASQNELLKKRKLMHLNTSTKKVKLSKFSLINKRMQPMCMMTPVKKEKTVLVRRLYKSKNVIVNKNATLVSNSAKLIKSKYLTLNRRKSPNWMTQNPYSKVPPQLKKFKGYSLAAKLHAKRIGYWKTFQPILSRKFTSYGCQTSSGHFSKNIKTKKYIRNMHNRYDHHPVVLIHGMKYSRNASGKTLKKLPIKGKSTKLFRRNSGKFSNSNENSFKMLTPSTNLASRVLNRSINRILTASSKKHLIKVNTYCMFYNRFGRCNRGIKCTYIHDPSKIAVCTRFLRGTCKVDGCPFSHEVAPGKMAICSLFLIGVCEKENCPYRHEKLSHDAVLCKAFVQGYCPKGKECKKAHILICPKYMQGECDKGSSCDFPHPPQKARKNVQKDVDVEEEKPDDVLLEKVFRYFQQRDNNSSNPENKFDENITANMFVPRQKKLEEQPSFIPLSSTPEISHID